MYPDAGVQCADLSGAPLGWGVLILSPWEDRWWGDKGGGASWDAVGFSVLSISAYLGVGALPTHAERPWERPALI